MPLLVKTRKSAMLELMAIFVISGLGLGRCQDAVENNVVLLATVNHTISFPLPRGYSKPLRLQHQSPMTDDSPFIFNDKDNRTSTRYVVDIVEHTQHVQLLQLSFTQPADFLYAGLYILTANRTRVAEIAVNVLDRVEYRVNGKMAICTVWYSGPMKPDYWVDDARCPNQTIESANKTMHRLTCRYPFDNNQSCLLKFDESGVNVSWADVSKFGGRWIARNVPTYTDVCQSRSAVDATNEFLTTKRQPTSRVPEISSTRWSFGHYFAIASLLPGFLYLGVLLYASR